jgi:hypothetical protein
MYTSFRIQNFRCFEDLTLDNLGRVNLIAGKNNTGKTSVLDVLMFLSGQHDILTILRASFDSREVNDLPEWDSLFNNFNIEKPIQFRANFNRKEQNDNMFWFCEIYKLKDLDAEHIAPRARQLMENAGGYQSDDSSNQRVTGILVKTVEHWGQDAVDYIILRYARRVRSERNSMFLHHPIAYLNSNRAVSARLDARRYSELDRIGKLSLFVEAMQTVEPRLKSPRLSYRGDPPVIVGDLDLREPLAISQMGEGMNRIASIILAIANAENGIALIDEIENGLHHAVLADVWRAIGKAANDFNVQIFATTHSYECIKAAHEAFEGENTNDLWVHRLERDNENKINVVSIEHDKLGSAIEFGFEVR